MKIDGKILGWLTWSLLSMLVTLRDILKGAETFVKRLTLAKTKIIYPKNVGASVAMNFT